jgi:hypothetical protein
MKQRVAFEANVPVTATLAYGTTVTCGGEPQAKEYP